VTSRFRAGLVAYTRSRLHAPILPGTAEAEDVLQSAFLSFFKRFAAGEVELTAWAGLWRLLLTIVRRKCIRYIERSQAKKRGHPVTGVDDLDCADNCLPPETAAEYDDLVEWLMSRLVEQEREILLCLLQEKSVAEITRTLGCTRRHVERAIAVISGRLGEAVSR
jgi:RNA polymerase sigma-70 factor (ECF subfamily)